jgi:hypothetical protein
MKLPDNYMKIQKRITELEIAIQDGIDKICERDNFEVTYAEINCAVTKILQRNIGYEVRALYKPTKGGGDEKN